MFFLVASEHIIMWGCCTLSKLVSEKRFCILNVITFILEGTAKARRIWMFTMNFKNKTITPGLPKQYHRKRYSSHDFNWLNTSNAALSALFLVSLLSCLHNHPIEGKLQHLEITRHFFGFFYIVKPTTTPTSNQQKLSETFGQTAAPKGDGLNSVTFCDGLKVDAQGDSKMRGQWGAVYSGGDMLSTKNRPWLKPSWQSL